jgi:hypothetical protein
MNTVNIKADRFLLTMLNRALDKLKKLPRPTDSDFRALGIVEDLIVVARHIGGTDRHSVSVEPHIARLMYE